MRLRVLIADDEALSRERLRQFLLAEPRTEIVAECKTGLEAVEKIRQTSPELVFLDVRMPEMDGFSVLEELKGERQPVIVFVTAHHQFAARAFDVHAVDYLLKPFDRARFQTAFQRALERLDAATSKPSKTFPEAENKITSHGRLVVKSQGRISLINVTDIDWIRAADNYVELHLAKVTHLLRASLKDLEVQLPKQSFVRISRSHLVNLERVKEIRSKSHGDALVVLQDGEVLPASRIFLREVRRLISTFR